MSALLENPISLILALGAVITTILYLREYNLRSKLEREGDKILQDAQVKGWDSLHQAIKKSQTIIGQAELEGVKVAADTKFATSKLEEELKVKIAEIIQESQQSITAAQAQFFQYLESLQNRSAEFEEASRKAGEQRINQLFERLENKLSDFLISTEQKTTSSIELELKSARELIEAYKGQQLKLIDENIIAMMEQTLASVLGKKLSVKDQIDLIYEALERAKVEKFIV